MENIQHVENRLVGTCIAISGRYFQVSDYIYSHLVFRSALNQTIWRIMDRMDAEGIPIEITTLAANAEKFGFGKGVTVNDLVNLTEWSSPNADISQHCKLVLEDYMRRESQAVAGQLVSKAKQQEQDIFDSIEEASIALEELTSNLVQGKPKLVGELTEERIEAAKQRVEKRKEAERTGKSFTDGIPSGLQDLDEVVNGAVGGRLYIVGARPGMGKTAMTVNNLCREAGVVGEPSLFKSIEMPEGEIVDRLLCSEAGVSYGKFQKGYLDKEDIGKLVSIQDVLKKYKIHIEDKGGITVTKIRASVRKYKREFGISMLVVDNLDIVKGKGYNRENEISNISLGFKRLAIELDIPVFIISHLNRQCEGREVKIPHLSDLRHSGSIEQNADCVIFLYRPIYYGLDYAIKAHSEIWTQLLSHFGDTSKAENVMQELAWADVAKNRGLMTGSVPLRFVGRYTKFFDWEDPEVRRILGLKPMISPAKVQTHTQISNASTADPFPW